MRSYSSLVAALLWALLLIDHTDARYERLNNYLVGNVDNDTVGSNMEAAAKWLKEKDGAKHSFLSRTPIRDLRKFTALQQVIDDNKCDRHAYAIMHENEEAVGLHTLIRYRQVFRRVDKVMAEILQKHAEKCAKVYPVTYRTKKAQLNAALFEQAKTIAETVMSADRFRLPSIMLPTFYQPLDLFYRYIKYNPTLESFERGGILHDALYSNAKNDPDLKYTRAVPDERTGRAVVHKDKLRELTRKYLIEPCRHLDNELGPDLFVPARFDLPHYFDPDKDERGYYIGWAYYKICQALTKDEQGVYDRVAKFAAHLK